MLPNTAGCGKGIPRTDMFQRDGGGLGLPDVSQFVAFIDFY